MMEEKNIPNRRPDEHLMLFVRQHWFNLLISFSFTFIMAVVPVALYFIAPEIFDLTKNSETFRVFFVGVFTLYYLIILLMTYNRFIDHHLDVWVVTNFRIIAIEQNNIFNRTISEQLIERIQDVSANQKGILQTMFNYGDVTVQTAAEEKKFVFNNVAEPFKVAQTINDLLSKKAIH